MGGDGEAGKKGDRWGKRGKGEKGGGKEGRGERGNLCGRQDIEKVDSPGEETGCMRLRLL